MNERILYSVYTLVMHLTHHNTGQQQLKCVGVDALKPAMVMSAGQAVECYQQIVKYSVPARNMEQAQIYHSKILTHQVET
jgi:hypothetical protein